MATPTEAEQAFQDQEEEEKLVEIDELGNIHMPGDAPRRGNRKPTIIRDPLGEY